jgi:hypothetical protein
MVTVSIVFIYEYITGSATVNQRLGFYHISLLMASICNNEVIPSISFWSTIAKPDKRDSWWGHVSPMCVPLSAHGTSSFLPICRKKGHHVKHQWWLQQVLSVLCRHWTGRELRGPNFHVVDIPRDVHWSRLTSHGQSPHRTSIVLLGYLFYVTQALRSFGEGWDPWVPGLYLWQ